MCASLEPERFRMGEAFELGRRPFVRDDAAETTGEGLACCPGVQLSHDANDRTEDHSSDLFDGWGPVLEVWEGAAADEEIRLAGSSGGAASALALYCIEAGGMERVVHTGARSDVPYLNETVFSENRAELISRSGSRYAPASPCDRLDEVAKMEGRSVFIGKPCDVAAVQKARKIRPELDEKLGCVIGFFCAGAPSTKGTLALLNEVGIPDPSRLKSLRYRGNGWPGLWTAVYEDDEGREQTIERTYADSWGFVQRYRQWRCYICPDHTGEFADLAVGDPWYREVRPGESGSSLIIVRTERGRKILRDAVAAGYIMLQSQDETLLPRSQPNLLEARGSLWGRLKVLRLCGAAAPVYRGFRFFPFWLRDVSFRKKILSFVSTYKRLGRKLLRKRLDISEWSPPSD
jgi:coenzyme F420 hydrogenase subunit beta